MKKKFLLLAVVVIVGVALFFMGPAGGRNVAAPSQTNSTAQASAPSTSSIPPATLALIHFAGPANISKDTNFADIKNIFCSTQAVALESQTLNKLALTPSVWLKDKLPAGAGDGSAQLRPLLGDFLKSEWFFEVRDGAASPDYALAIRLDDKRAQLWQTNLRTLLESWTKISATNIPGGWELKKDLPPNLLRVVRAGDWLVIGCGQDVLPLADEWGQGKLPQNDGNWLSADLDWPLLAPHFPALAKFDFPKIQMQVAGTNHTLLVSGKLNLSEPLPALGAWDVPTNIIHQPLTSFTAARGFETWLTNQSWGSQFNLSPEPNQFFIWSLSGMPLQTFIAVPVASATNALAQLGQNFNANTNWQSHLMSPLGLSVTNNRISLPGVPFIAPEILALRERTGDILFGDAFPNPPFGKLPPPEIFAPLSQDNLVFYHWENSPARLTALPQLTQLALLLTKHRQLGQNSASFQWLNSIAPKLGASVTIVTQTGPGELTFSRTANSGLTALELIALANWLEAPNFPGCNLSLPPSRFRPFHKPMKKLDAPAPAPPIKH